MQSLLLLLEHKMENTELKVGTAYANQVTINLHHFLNLYLFIFLLT